MEIDIKKLKEINRQFIEALERGDFMLCLKLQMQFEYLLPKNNVWVSLILSRGIKLSEVFSKCLIE